MSKISVNTEENKVTVLSDKIQTVKVNAVDQNRVVKILTPGPKGDKGDPGDSAISSSYALTASYALNGGTGAGFPYTGSAGITGSLYVVGPANVISIPSYQSDDFFLIKNSTTTFKINNSTGVEITSSAEIPLNVLNQNNQSIFYVSQSGVIVLNTSSIELNNPAPNGGIYFTSTDIFVGLS